MVAVAAAQQQWWQRSGSGGSLAAAAAAAKALRCQLGAVVVVTDSFVVAAAAWWCQESVAAATMAAVWRRRWRHGWRLLQLGAGGAVVAALPRQQCNRVRAILAAAAAWLRCWRRQLSGGEAAEVWWHLRQRVSVGSGGVGGSATAQRWWRQWRLRRRYPAARRILTISKGGRPQQKVVGWGQMGGQ